MRRHALADTAFAALAAGRPSAATIDELRRAQLGKHLLLLRAIVQAAPEQTRPAYARLTAADPAVVRARVADPLFGAWAASCLRALAGGDTSDLAEMAERAVGGPGPPVLTPVPRDDGEGGRAVGGPVPRDDGEGGRAVGGPVPRDRGGDARRRITAIRDGLAIEVRLEDADPVRSRLGLTPAGRLSAGQVAHWQDCLAAAWRLLVDRHRPAAEVLAAVLRVIVPVEPDPAACGISATSADAYGAVAMSVPRDGTELAVGLLHETQHSLLNAVHYLFDLHRDPGRLGYSAWRDDPRPASGILHGAYAYLAVTRFWRTEVRHGAGRLAAFEFARWREAVASAAGDLLASGGLTPAGTRFVAALRDEVRPWLDEPVPAGVARLAAAANADHRARWRLRNLAVDEDAARALAEMWRRGEPAPRDPAPARLVPAGRRALEDNHRLHLAHRLLGGDHAGTTERAVRGDHAWVRGDLGTARRAYLKRVFEEPGDDAAWAGVALVSRQRALRETPEVVAAVYRLVRDEGVDVPRLAEWISG